LTQKLPLWRAASEIPDSWAIRLVIESDIVEAQNPPFPSLRNRDDVRAANNRERGSVWWDGPD
jgi:hypothetical protein